MPHRPARLRTVRRLAAFALLAVAALLAVPAVPGAASAPVPAATAVADDPGVILYATAWCGWCRKTRALLQQLDVEYADKDIETSPEAAREHREKAGPRAGVPVLDIGGTIVRGYDEETIRDLVGKLKAKEARAAA